MPTFPHEVKANQQFDAFFRAAVWKQRQLFDSNTKFTQFLPTHTVIPVDGADVTPDNLAAKPADESLSWNDAGLTPGTTTVAFSVDSYTGPRGPGMVLVGRTQAGTTVYKRTKNFGPDKSKTSDWEAE